MRKLLFAIAFILVLILAGVIYMGIEDGSEVESEIKVGEVPIDYPRIEELQQQVDEGRQPWRLDPLLVAEAELGQHGFTAEDIQTLQLPTYVQDELGITITTLQGKITHKQNIYLITLAQPTSGPGKIWAITDIREK